MVYIELFQHEAQTEGSREVSAGIQGFRQKLGSGASARVWKGDSGGRMVVME